MRTSNAAHSQAFAHPIPPHSKQAHLGYSALHIAVATSQTSVVSWLMKHGADPLVRTCQDYTPLMINVGLTADTALATALLDNCKTPALAREVVRARDKFGCTAFHMAVNYSGRHGSDSSRNFAEAFRMENLLLSHGADLNALDDWKRTPLHYVFVPIVSHFTVVSSYLCCLTSLLSDAEL